MRNQIVVAAVIILLLMAGAWYLISSGGKPNTGPQVTTTQSPTENSSPSSTASPDQTVKTFEVTGKSFEFNPREIRVKKGDRVRINFTSTEGFHDWTIDGYDLDTKQIQVSQTDSVEFVADKTGTFEYFCSVGNHRQMGMVGQLVVEE